jgi:hypothetical protein
LARNDDKVAANKSSDCVALALFGSSGIASCPKSPTIAMQSMNSSTTKESSFFGSNDMTHSLGSTGGFTFGANAAESTPARAALLFPMAAGGAGTTFGRPFTFGTSMVMESTQTPTMSTFTGLAGGAYSGEGNEKGATFEFGATFGGPFTFGSNVATQSSPAPSASTFTMAAGGATFDQGTENTATFAFGTSAGVDLCQSQGYPVNRMPVEVPLEELDSNSVLARVPVSSPPPSTTLGAYKNKCCRLDDGPSETKRMK